MNLVKIGNATGAITEPWEVVYSALMMSRGFLLAHHATPQGDDGASVLHDTVERALRAMASLQQINEPEVR